MKTQKTPAIIRTLFIAIMAAALLLATLFPLNTSAAAQQLPAVNTLDMDRLRAHAEQGYIGDQLKLARALELGVEGKADPTEAARWFLKAANLGDPAAQTYLGYLYMRGEGMPRDEKQALQWFQRAAADGYAPAQYDLGYLLVNGLGVQQDPSAGALWLERSAQQGFAPAQLNLAVLYSQGLGRTRDDREAMRWCRKAVKQHFAPAEFFLALMYENGNGVAKDPSQAARWYRKSAEQGYAQAENNLGVLYEDGKGVSLDREEALKWYKRAAEQGNGNSYMNLARLCTRAQDYSRAYYWALLAQRSLWAMSSRPSQRRLALLRGHLTSDQIASVERQVEDWLNKHHPIPPV